MLNKNMFTLLAKKEKKVEEAPKQYEYGAYFKTQDLFSKLLDLVNTLPVDRLGKNGIYFQKENTDANPTIFHFEKAEDFTVKNKSSTGIFSFPPITRVFSPQKSKTIKFTSPRQGERTFSFIKDQQAKYDLIEKSVKMARTTKKHSTTHKIIKKESNSKRIFLKTKDTECPRNSKIDITPLRKENRKLATSQNTLSSVIRILQKGKNKYLDEEALFPEKQRRISFKLFSPRKM